MNCIDNVGITPLEVRELEKVDAVVFGHDKFAFEMVHFLKASLGKKGDRPSSGSKAISSKSIEDLWETNFVQGLETLLVECAVVNDDIERDCFVSRVYCWFTEKLQERRDLPRKSKHDRYAPVLDVLDGLSILLDARVENLRASIERLGGEQTHTLRGLDAYEKSLEQMSLQDKLAASHGQVSPCRVSTNLNAHGCCNCSQVAVDPNDRDLPTIAVPDKKSRFGTRHVPAYVKQGFPNVLSTTPLPDNFGRGTTPGGEGMFPKIPGAEENYGMVHNVPETAAEKAMHEMWMARRRQEVRLYSNLVV
jgi:hypothetical protein